MMNNNFRPLTATSPVASPTILATAGEKKKPGLLESIVLGGASCVFTVNVSLVEDAYVYNVIARMQLHFSFILMAKCFYISRFLFSTSTVHPPD